ncbi:hypothetical protein B0I37DRAFT_377017 [Chaetomium sp. MPI-CAGE-AT-0009]|nr:hypothetical protein B0I37DRAFT_377017 [Chaetomium sp. MPI-CAGE-AT-0009]
MANSTSSPPSPLTLGDSGDMGSRASPVVSAYNLDRFVDQTKYDDGTLHGRLLDNKDQPLPDAHVLSYEARAVAVIAACDAVLNRDFAEAHPK